MDHDSRCEPPGTSKPAIEEGCPNPPFLDWYERHVKWIAPIAAGLFLAFFVGMGTLMLGVYNSTMMKTDVFALSWEAVSSHPLCKEQMGEDAKLATIFSISGSIDLRGDAGSADFQYGVVGQEGRRGTVFVNAEKKEGVWYFNKLDLRVDNKRLNLRKETDDSVQSGRAGSLTPSPP